MLCWCLKVLLMDVADVLIFCLCYAFLLIMYWFLTSMKNKCCNYILTKCWCSAFFLMLYWLLCWQNAYVLLMLMQHWYLVDETLMKDWFMWKSIYFSFIFCRWPLLVRSTQNPVSIFRNCLLARQVQHRVLVPHPSGAPPLSPPLHQEIPAQAQSTQGRWRNDSTISWLWVLF